MKHVLRLRWMSIGTTPKLYRCGSFKKNEMRVPSYSVPAQCSEICNMATDRSPASLDQPDRSWCFAYILDCGCLVQALQESSKYVSKSQKADKADIVALLNARMAATSAFLEAQGLFTTSSAAAVQICNGLVVQVNLADAT